MAQIEVFLYPTRAITTRGLYIYYPIYKGQKCLLKELFCKILPLYTVSIQEWVMMAPVQYITFSEWKSYMVNIVKVELKLLLKLMSRSI